MDGQRFDQLSRVLAANRNRRQLLAAVVGGLVAGIVSPRGRWRAQAACPPGQTDCGGICVDLMWNKYHCGACDSPCVGQWGCCAGVCADFYSDPSNCGGCGKVCPVGASCVNAACACTGGQTDCFGTCVDLQTDPFNCGACNMVCFTGNCVNGACACPPGQTDCFGTCVDLQTDTYHCGACGNACVGVPGPGQSSIGQCVNGHCQVVCEPGFYDCGLGCSDLQSDPANCGGCGVVCGQYEYCDQGQCKPAAAGGPCTTPAGTKGVECDGVCVDTRTDPDNCGLCNMHCMYVADGYRLSCCAGSCVDLQTDPYHCGACYHDCTGVPGPGQLSVGQCVTGVCRVVCEPGYTACPWDGNERCVNLQTDEQNCGACGKRCAAEQTCVDGACRPAVAPSGQVDKWKLWTRKSQLRGAHLLQVLVDPDADGPALGPGSVGPSYARTDVARLASLGANYVEVVHPVPVGLIPPYKTDRKLRDNLDQLLDRAARAGLFVVLGFRSGPGRPEGGLAASPVCQAGGCLVTGEDGNEVTLWDDEEVQDAWAAAWAATARRYRDHPAVVGYDLLVAPDAPGLTSWEELAGRLSEAVRDADRETPLLVSLPADPTELLDWRPGEDERTVYRLDLFPPERYLLQAFDAAEALTYPGRFDPAQDGATGRFDQAWIEGRTLALEAFGRRHEVPVAVGAYGIGRWQPGAADYLTDLLATIEAAGLSHGLWLWHPEDWTGADALDIERGTDPDQREAVPNELLDAVRKYWKKNKAHPPEV